MQKKVKRILAVLLSAVLMAGLLAGCSGGGGGSGGRDLSVDISKGDNDFAAVEKPKDDIGEIKLE